MAPIQKKKTEIDYILAGYRKLGSDEASTSAVMIKTNPNQTAT